MKVLFAVNNDNVVEAIVKKYQKDYKEILSYKNVYYFNAILRELQKDKSYSRVVISEDLEPFANNNYVSIDKFLLEKYNNIADEARSMNSEKIDIILICADRRKKTDSILSHIYKKEIYNAIIGQDRSVDEVCRLIYSPRDKEKAKMYYGIQESELGENESENSVSEAEVENIRAHYARLGKNEDKYLESFNNIVAQYTDTQLKIIIKYLPMNVKAVLEERSPKYQQLVTSGGMGDINAKLKTSNYKEQLRNNRAQQKNEEEFEQNDVIEQLRKTTEVKNVVVPTNLKTENVQKVVIPTINKPEISKMDLINSSNTITNVNKEDDDDLFTETMESVNQDKVKETLLSEMETEEVEDVPQNVEANIQERIVEPENIETIEPQVEQQVTVEEQSGIEEVPQVQKRGRGRPRKNPLPEEVQENKPKRGRGRPRKNPLPEEQGEDSEQNIISQVNINENIEQEGNSEIDVKEDVNLFDLEENNIKENEEVVDLFNMQEEQQAEDDLFDIKEEKQIPEPVKREEEKVTVNANEQELDLFSIEEEPQNDAKQVQRPIQQEPLVVNNIVTQEASRPSVQNPVMQKNEEVDNSYLTRTSNIGANYSNLLTSDKKIVAFVGTTKNGTSFIVNNTAEMLSSMGINTAVLDMTKSKNAFYIYTNDKEDLRNIARECMQNLQNGMPKGIEVNKNLTIYTEMPGEGKDYQIETILTTLLENYSAILIDTDFETPFEVFQRVQELYLVQTMDVLTIQPLTAFLRNLKSKDILKQEKLKIVINKSERVRSLSIKTLIGGMSCYNAPSMTYMTELFDKDNIAYCEIPFEEQNYVKYLDSLVNCSITLNGYTKQLCNSLRELANTVYPLVNRQPMKGNKVGGRNTFSSEVNDTLSKMKNRY